LLSFGTECVVFIYLNVAKIKMSTKKVVIVGLRHVLCNNKRMGVFMDRVLRRIFGHS